MLCFMRLQPNVKFTRVTLRCGSFHLIKTARNTVTFQLANLITLDLGEGLRTGPKKGANMSAGGPTNELVLDLGRPSVISF